MPWSPAHPFTSLTPRPCRCKSLLCRTANSQGWTGLPHNCCTSAVQGCLPSCRGGSLSRDDDTLGVLCSGPSWPMENARQRRVAHYILNASGARWKRQPHGRDSILSVVGLGPPSTTANPRVHVQAWPCRGSDLLPDHQCVGTSVARPRRRLRLTWVEIFYSQ